MDNECRKTDLIRELEGVPVCSACHRTIRVNWWMWTVSKVRVYCNDCFWKQQPTGKEVIEWGKRLR